MLTFVRLTPVWGALIIGLGFLLGDIANNHAGFTLLNRALTLVVAKRKFEVHEAYLGNRQTYEEIYAAIVAGQQNARRPARTTPPAASGDDSRYMPKE